MLAEWSSLLRFRRIEFRIWRAQLRGGLHHQNIFPLLPPGEV